MNYFINRKPSEHFYWEKLRLGQVGTQKQQKKLLKSTAQGERVQKKGHT